MLKKLASKKVKDRHVTFTVTVCALDDWSSPNRRLCVGWERGASRRGTTPVREGTRASGGGARYEFESTFTVEATVQSGRAKGLKLFVLALPADAARGQEVETRVVGGCDVDLAQFADAREDVSVTLRVECDEEARSAVGTPRLTIRVRAAGEGEATESTSTTPERSRDGYQWAASRFREEDTDGSARESDSAAAFTKTANMFKKRETQVSEPPQPVAAEAERAKEDAQEKASRDELFDVTPVVKEEKVRAEDEIDPELEAARRELFGARAAQAATATSPKGAVDEDGFLLDSDLDEDEEDGDITIEFGTAQKAEVGGAEAALEAQREAEEEALRAERERIAEEEARLRAEEEAVLARIEAERTALEQEERERTEKARFEAKLAEEEKIRMEQERLARIEIERAKAEEEARRLAEEDALIAELEEERVRKEEEERARADQASREAEEQRLRMEAEAQRSREAEEQRLRMEVEAQRSREAEEQRLQMEAEAQRSREAEEQRLQIEAEAERERSATVEIPQIAADDSARDQEEALRVAREEEALRRFEEEDLRVAELEARLQQERERQWAEEKKAAETREVDVYAEAVISEDADDLLFADSPKSVGFSTPATIGEDSFYTPATHRTRLADSTLKAVRNRELEDEVVAMSICDMLIHGSPTDANFSTALGLQERIAVVRSTRGPHAAELEFRRVMDSFGVAIKGAIDNPARLVFLATQLIALRVCLATMDDIDTRDVLELEIVARNSAFESLWTQTYGSLLPSNAASLSLLNLSAPLNGDGERIGRAWSVMFQFAKARLGVDRVANARSTGWSAKPLLQQLHREILRDLMLRLDLSVLETLLKPKGDANANDLIPGKGHLTFSAGAELKRAISALAGIVKELNFGTGPDSITPKLRATADVCMIPKDALIDAKLRSDIVCGKLSGEELSAIIIRFQPDDFAPQPVDRAVVAAVVAAAASDEGEFSLPTIDPCVPVSTENAPWVANLARALAQTEDWTIDASRVPGPSAHAGRWALVAESLTR